MDDIVVGHSLSPFWLHLGRDRPAAMERARNTAPLSVYERALRGTTRRLDPDLFQDSSLSSIVDLFEDFLTELLKSTSRPLRSFIAKAAVNVFGVEPELGLHFDMRTIYKSLCSFRKLRRKRGVLAMYKQSTPSNKRKVFGEPF
jgi:hypothetical protein